MKKNLIARKLNTRKAIEGICKFYDLPTVGSREKLENQVLSLTYKQITNYLKTQS